MTSSFTEQSLNLRVGIIPRRRRRTEDGGDDSPSGTGLPRQDDLAALNAHALDRMIAWCFVPQETSRESISPVDVKWKDSAASGSSSSQRPTKISAPAISASAAIKTCGTVTATSPARPFRISQIDKSSIPALRVTVRGIFDLLNR